jgi:hypothetical protein
MASNRKGNGIGNVGLGGLELYFIVEGEWNQTDVLSSNRVGRGFNLSGELLGRISLRNGALGLPEAIRFNELQTVSNGNKNEDGRKR